MSFQITAVDPSLLNCPVFYITGLPKWNIHAAMEKNPSGSVIKKILGTSEDGISNFFVEYNREYRYNQAEEQMKVQMQQMQQQMGGMFGYNSFGMPENIMQGMYMQNLPGMPVTHQPEQSALPFQGFPSATPPLAAADYIRKVFVNQNLNLSNSHGEKLTLLPELCETRKEEIDTIRTALHENLQQNSLVPFPVQTTFDVADFSVCYEHSGLEMIYFSEVLLIYTSYSLPFMNSVEISWRQPVLTIYMTPVSHLENVKNQVNEVCKTIKNEPQYQKLQENEQRHNKEMLDMQQRTNDQINASVQQTINRQQDSNSRILNAWMNVLSR